MEVSVEREIKGRMWLWVIMQAVRARHTFRI